MKTQCDVIVVGGGASGLLCAVMLAKKDGAGDSIRKDDEDRSRQKTIGNRKWQMQFYQFTYE